MGTTVTASMIKKEPHLGYVKTNKIWTNGFGGPQVKGRERKGGVLQGRGEGLWAVGKKGKSSQPPVWWGENQENLGKSITGHKPLQTLSVVNKRAMQETVRVY